MAYITQYNYSRIWLRQEVPHKIVALCPANLNLTIDWFSSLELTRLYLCKLIATDPQHLMCQRALQYQWLRLPPPPQDPHLLYRVSAPSFHNDSPCHRCCSFQHQYDAVPSLFA